MKSASLSTCCVDLHIALVVNNMLLGRHYKGSLCGARWLLSKGILKYAVVTLNTLRPRQNGRHFTDDIFKCIFLNWNIWILIKISLKFVPKGQINNIPAMVQLLAPSRRQAIFFNQWWLVYRRIYASLGLNDLKEGPVKEANVSISWAV